MQEMKARTFRFRDVPGALWFFLGEDRIAYAKYFGLFLLTQSYELLPPFLIGLMVDFLLSYQPGESIATLGWLIGAIVMGGVFAALLRIGSRRKLGEYAVNAQYRAKVWGFERILDFSLAWHQSEGAGNKAQRILTGAESLREWFSFLYSDLTTTLLAICGAVVACILLSPWFAFFFVYFLAGLLLIELHFDRKVAAMSLKINQSMENASGAFVEGAANILAVKALGAADGVLGRVEAREAQTRQFRHQRVRLHTEKMIAFQLHNSVAWGVFLSIVAWAVLDGRVSAGMVLMYVSYFNNMRMNSMNFVDRFQTMVERHADLARMMPFFQEKHQLAKGAAHFPEQWDAIEFRNAVFRYENSHAQSHIDLRVARGENLGIAGGSGAGKSTLFKLLLGLYHLESGVLNIGGTPVRTIAHDALAAHIAVVLQETDLLNMSLKDNITMMREPDPQRFALACRIACLDELIDRLPDGANTVIGERGYSLSGGERQRIGIARAVYKNAQILLLDEATSALDSATEEKIMTALLGDYAQGRTMLIVAHRISTLRNTDRIVVLENGRAVEEGRYSTLIEDDESRFGRMHVLQS